MLRAQEAYDAMSRMTLEGRSLCLEILKASKGSEGAKQLASQGLDLCRDLVQPTEELETILRKTKEDALRSVAPIFMRAMKLMDELKAMHRHWCKRAAARSRPLGLRREVRHVVALARIVALFTY